MPSIKPPAGLYLDIPWASPAPSYVKGYNIRWRLVGNVETVGLHGPLRRVDGTQVTLTADTLYRKIFTTPSTTTGQILVGSADSLILLQYDPASTTATGTRWKEHDVTPSPISTSPDVITNPSAGRVEIPPACISDRSQG